MVRKEILKRTNPNELNSNSGHSKVVEYLIEKGADVDARDNYGYSALMRSSSKGNLECW